MNITREGNSLNTGPTGDVLNHPLGEDIASEFKTRLLPNGSLGCGFQKGDKPKRAQSILPRTALEASTHEGVLNGCLHLTTLCHGRAAQCSCCGLEAVGNHSYDPWKRLATMAGWVATMVPDHLLGTLLFKAGKRPWKKGAQNRLLPAIGKSTVAKHLLQGCLTFLAYFLNPIYQPCRHALIGVVPGILTLYT